jgi:hypothetical protein
MVPATPEHNLAARYNARRRRARSVTLSPGDIISVCVKAFDVWLSRYSIQPIGCARHQNDDARGQ